nr:reverse transcriptase domain-containing protein [Tanacetum cinerariifolium]
MEGDENAMVAGIDYMVQKIKNEAKTETFRLRFKDVYAFFEIKTKSLIFPEHAIVKSMQIRVRQCLHLLLGRPDTIYIGSDRPILIISSRFKQLFTWYGSLLKQIGAIRETLQSFLPRKQMAGPDEGGGPEGTDDREETPPFDEGTDRRSRVCSQVPDKESQSEEKKRRPHSSKFRNGRHRDYQEGQRVINSIQRKLDGGNGFYHGSPGSHEISSFMDSVKSPELAKRFSDKVPTTVNEMMERLDDFVDPRRYTPVLNSLKGKRESLRKISFPSNGRDVWPLRNTCPMESRRDDYQNRHRGRDTYRANRPREDRAPYPPPREEYNRRVAQEPVGDGTGIEKVEPPGKGRTTGRKGTPWPRRSTAGQDNQCDQCNAVKNKKRKVRETTESWMNIPITFPAISAKDISEEPLIVEAEVEEYLVRRVYVDEGSSVEVMFEHCFENPNPKIKAGRTFMKFIVVRAPSPYNIILWRPGLKTLRAIPSIIHAMIKFPTPKGVATLVTRTLITAECRRLEKKQMVEEVSPEEKGEVAVTKEVLVNPSFLDQIVTISRGLSEAGRDQLKCLLKDNVEVFAWEPADMTGVPRRIIGYVLNVNPSLDPVCQKRRTFFNRKEQGGLPPNSNGRRGRRKNDILHRSRDVLLYKNAIRFEKCESHIPKAGRLNLPVPNRRKNLEAYVDGVVIKSRDEKMLLADISETFDNLKKINMKLNPKKCSFGVEEGNFLGYMVTSEGIRANPRKKKALADLQSPQTLKEMQSLSGKLAALNRFLAKSVERSLPFFNTLENITKENKHEYRWTHEAEEAFQQIKKLIMDLSSLTLPWEKRTLYAYLAVSTESNYAPMEKLALALIHITRRLRRYFEAHPVLADFLSKAPKGEKEELYFRMPEVPLEKDDTGSWTLFTDGASSLKGSGAGLVLIEPNGIEYTYAFRLTFPSTNNEAEYKALLARLRIARQMNISNIEVKVNSKLVASQINGSYEANKDIIIKYLAKANEYSFGFKSFSIENILRNMNQKVDVQSRLASVAFNHLTNEVLVEVLNKRSTEGQEIHTIVEEKGDNWMTPIRRCLEEGIWPKDRNEARCLRAKIGQYAMESGILFKKGYLVPMLRCVGPLQANYVIREIHMGSCVPRLLKTLMTSIMAPWPFYQWGMDILGPLPPARGGAKFVIVAIDYFTKWIEAKPLVKITGKGVIRFVMDNIICRFGLPWVIVTDNGAQLVNDPFKSWCERFEIHQMNTAVAHPQANKLLERANRSLKEGIKTRLGREKAGWVDELPNVLWAHRTSTKQSNEETPFSLTYGGKAVIPAKIGIPTYRTLMNREEYNEEEMRLNLDLLQEMRETAAIREEIYKTKMEQYYNKKVRSAGFRPGEFVFRRNEASMVKDQGKLGPKWEGPYRVVKAYKYGSYKLQTLEDKEVPRTWHAINLLRCYM